MVIKEKIRKRIEKLRLLMKQEGIDAYIIVSDDFHGSEYVGDYFKCREFISGFDGSAGTVVVMEDKAGLWTDGRYYIQAEKQLEDTGITLYRQGVEGVADIYTFIRDNLETGQCVGFDGRTISISFSEALNNKITEKKIGVRADVDLVGKMWKNRPEFPHNHIWSLDERYSGKSSKDKINDLITELEKKKTDGILLTSLDDICWLFNIRGYDIMYTPVALSYAYISTDKVVLYAAKEEMDNETVCRLEKIGVDIRPYLAVYDDVGKLENGKKVLVDCSSTNLTLLNCINDDVEIIKKENPVKLAKCVKNSTELDNERAAHIKDGVAVTKLIYHLKNDLRESIVKGQLTELQVANLLHDLRMEQEGFLIESFASIIATGEHGAIVHYEPTELTDVSIENNSFLLMDTGGHYYQGTTDITRTVAVGEVDDVMRSHYTAVLQGNLNLGDAYFKEGVTGENLDYIARVPLWNMGLDYNHGTGHGVGYLMNVHEGPNGVRLRTAQGKLGVPFKEGMITSNEPGVYLEGKYGIRLENLIVCVKADKTEYGQFMRFETLTKVPFDIDAIQADMLSERQKELLNNYHKDVFDSISPYLEDDEREWLKKACRPV